MPRVGQAFWDHACKGAPKPSVEALLVGAGVPPKVARIAEAHVPSPLCETLAHAMVLSCMIADPQQLRASLPADTEHRARAVKRARFIAHPDKNPSLPELSTEAAKLVNNLS